MDRFNYRRYGRGNPPEAKQPAMQQQASSARGGEAAGAAAVGGDGVAAEFDFEPVDNCLSSVLSQEVCDGEAILDFKMKIDWLFFFCSGRTV